MWFFRPHFSREVDGSPLSFQVLIMRWTVLNPIPVISAILSGFLCLMQANNFTLLKHSNIFSTSTRYVFRRGGLRNGKLLNASVMVQLIVASQEHINHFLVRPTVHGTRVWVKLRGVRRNCQSMIFILDPGEPQGVLLPLSPST